MCLLVSGEPAGYNPYRYGKDGEGAFDWVRQAVRGVVPMTVIGKILVFLNLLFSVFVSGLIVLVYLTSTNWYNYAKKLEAQSKTISAAYQNELEAVNDLRIKLNNQTELSRRELKTLEDQLALAKQEQLRLAEAEQTKNSELVAARASEQRYLSQLKVQTEILENREKSIKERDQRIVEQQKLIGEYQAKATDWEMKYKNAQFRIDQLRTDLARVNEILRDMKQGGGAAVVAAPKITKPATQQPDANIRGQVTQIEGNILAISVGSDNGVKPDQTLYVSRLQPPTYLGTLRITRTNPREAIGIFEPSGPLKTPKAGDIVSSSLR
jgi:hypothetical protein